MVGIFGRRVKTYGYVNSNWHDDSVVSPGEYAVLLKVLTNLYPNIQIYPVQFLSPTGGRIW